MTTEDTDGGGAAPAAAGTPRAAAAPGAGAPPGGSLGGLSEQIASARESRSVASAAAHAAAPDSNGPTPLASGGSTRPTTDGPTRPASDEPGSAPIRHPSPWPSRLRVAAATLGEYLSRPPVRLAGLGLILLLIAGVVLPNSVWTLPLVIAGVLMVLTAWVGSRLSGRFLVEWGESGAQLEFRAQVKPAHHRRAALDHQATGGQVLSIGERDPAERRDRPRR